MAALVWDQVTEKLYETGVDHGVVYPYNSAPGAQHPYGPGYAWNGLTAVNESPSGAEATALYADNLKYLELRSAEQFAYTIEAYMYPEEFKRLDGSAKVANGVYLGQQKRGLFGFSYRTKVGNDVDGDDYGEKLHLVYNSVASPSGRNYATVNDSPEAITFSWEISTTPLQVAGHKPVITIEIDKATADPDKYAQLEAMLYGTTDSDPYLPLPEEIIALFADGESLAYTYTEVDSSTTGYSGMSPVARGWYEANGTNPETYSLSTDAVVDGTKTYYTRSLA